MMKDKTKSISRLYGIFMSVFLIALAVCLIIGCLSIYYGEGGYTRDVVGQVFGFLPIVSVFLVIFIVLGMFVFSVSKPASMPKTTLLDSMKKRFDADAADDMTKSSVYMLRTSRKKLVALCRCISAACLLVFAVYVLIPANYSKDINASVIKCMLVLLPCALVSLVSYLVVGRLIDKLIDAEISLLKKCPRRASGDDAVLDKKRFPVSAVLLVIAVASVVFGCLYGGTADVLTKAINICTECIGLG